jgi:hypothetical protein
VSKSKKLREVFGYIENQNSKVACAQASALYDVENDMIIASKITHYKTGERGIMQKRLAMPSNYA